MPKTFASSVLTILLLLATGATMYALSQSSPTDSSANSSDEAISSPPRDTDNPPGGNTPPQLGKEITTEGTVVCLTPKITNGAQIASCAIGLAQDNGVNYALGSPDPVLTGSLPTGQRVEVTGTLTEQASPYNISGVIQVTSVRRL